jgi:hypothetical protein
MKRQGHAGWAVLASLTLLAAPGQASVYGPLDNFDVVNDTGHETCGFEIEIEGVHSADIYRTFEAPYIRYAPPTLTDTASGVRIRYQGTWNPATQTFSPVTPPAPPGYVPADDSCWTGGLGAAYENAGCEHFGVSQTTQATATRYRWLECRPDGSVAPLPDIGLPTPNWTVNPPAVPGDPPVVRAEIEIPNPEGTPYGEPYWVKIYKTEAEDAIDLDQLLLDDPMQAGAVTEIEWELLQAKPGAGLVFNEGEIADGAEAVVRRYEFYRYNTEWGRTNTYIDPNSGLPVSYVNPENGEVEECVVNGCNEPTPDELGSYVGRQMAGFNIEPTACNNGVDDDGDGAADAADAGCRDATGDREDPQCQDGVNNGGAPGIDFDGGAAANGGVAIGASDPHCTQPWIRREGTSTCGLGAEVALVFGAIHFVRRRAAR